MRNRIIAIALVLGLAMAVPIFPQAQSQNVAPSDSMSNVDVERIGAFGLLWNSSAWVRFKAASLATMPLYSTTLSSVENGRAIMEKGSRWAVFSAPAAGSQATASIAAEASVRHVVDKVCFSGGSIANPAATVLLVNLRDGATGAGTIIQSWRVGVPAATGNIIPVVCIDDLQLVGTTNTAMTIEYSALLANLSEGVSMTGWNVF